MKVFQINTFATFSTGRIAVDLYKTLKENNHDSCIAFARGQIEEGIPYYRIGTDLDVKLHGIATRITDKTGFYSTNPTKALIQKIKEYNPDIIHLHNIHGYYLNIELLFNFLKEYNKPIVWTLHDCWPFTGHCAYFDMAKCNKWQSHCERCPQKSAYPKSLLLDNSSWNFDNKKELFCGVKNMVLVTPSQWLADLVKKSFLKEYQVKVINNGIDLSMFRPTESDLRKQYNLEDKFVILGVASTWDERKGLDDFIKLSKMLNDNFQIIVVGINEKQKKSLPNNIIGISRTHDVKELAQLYTMADVYINASVEETFGMPTIESMACGTPCIVYDATAIPEIVTKNTGYIVQPHDLKKVVQILNSHLINLHSIDCINYVKKFDKIKKFNEYIELYIDLISKG
ncbi:MAG: glycosyltransferase [Oscillospiraceae bacterium]